MAGTLTCGTLSDGTNSTSSTNPIRGSAKAWVSFNGASGAVNSSYNVSSVTKNGTGNYTVIMTSGMANTNYAIGMGGAYDTSANCRWMGVYPTSTTNIAVIYTNNTGAALDMSYGHVVVFA